MGKEKYKNKYRIDSARLKGYDYSTQGAYYLTIVTKNREHFFGKIINNEMELSEMGKIAQKYWDEIPIHFPFIKLDVMIIMPNHIHGILWIEKLDDDGVGNVGDNAMDDVGGDVGDDVADGAMDDVADGDVGECRDAINRVSTSPTPPPPTPPPSTPPPSSMQTSPTPPPSSTQTPPTPPSSTPPSLLKSSLSLDDKKPGGITHKNNPMFYDNISRVLRWYKGRCTFEINRDRKINQIIQFAWQPRFHDRIIRKNDELNRIRNYIVNNPKMWERDRNKPKM